MPISFEQIQNAQFFVEQNGEYIPVGHISEAELTVETITPTPEQEYYAYFSSEPIEFTAKMNYHDR